MSFVVTVYVPEGIVMASDSRQSITVEQRDPTGKMMSKVQTVGSDFTYKTFLLKESQVGINTFGQSHLENIAVESHVRRFEEEHVTSDDDVRTVAEKVLKFFKERFPDADTAFHIVGFKVEGKLSVPYVFYCHVSREELTRRNVKPGTSEVIYGATWGGESDVISRLLKPYQVRGPDNKPRKIQKPPIIYEAMNVQDAIDFAIYAVRATIETMRFEARPKTVGGPIDVLLITPGGGRWVQRKELHGETPSI